MWVRTQHWSIVCGQNSRNFNYRKIRRLTNDRSSSLRSTICCEHRRRQEALIVFEHRRHIFYPNKRGRVSHAKKQTTSLFLFKLKIDNPRDNLKRFDASRKCVIKNIWYTTFHENLTLFANKQVKDTPKNVHGFWLIVHVYTRGIFTAKHREVKTPPGKNLNAVVCRCDLAFRMTSWQKYSPR